MQNDQRDVQQSEQLLQRLEKMNTSLEAIQVHIGVTQQKLVPDDQEQTEVLEDLEAVRRASFAIKRAATLELDRRTLTTVDENTESSHPVNGDDKTPRQSLYGASFPGIDNVELGKARSSLKPIQRPAAVSIQSAPVPLRSATVGKKPGKSVLGSAWISTWKANLSVTDIPRPNPFARKSDPQRSASLKQTGKDALSFVPSKDQAPKEDTRTAVEVFEAEMSSLISGASLQTSGREKIFSEDEIATVSDLLRSVGKQAWSDRPRTYLVLRMIGEVKAMDTFVLEGLKDIDFPYKEDRLPDCFSRPGSRQSFILRQTAVLSPRSVALVQGGQHHHFGMTCVPIL
jgi:hypothetical protein